MGNGDDWSPGEPLGTETFEQGDDARDESSRVDPTFDEEVEEDPSLDPALEVDHRELEEDGGWDLDAPLISEDRLPVDPTEYGSRLVRAPF